MFYETIINSWKDALLVFETINLKVPTWAFRGQSDAKWGLSTKFERDANKYKCHSYWFKNREQAILRDFQRKADNYVHNLPVSENSIEWLSLIQHYGGPTRLLDFTYSYYVATFFAMEGSIVDSAIWAVNISKLLNHLSNNADLNLKQEDGYEGIIHQTNHFAETVISERRNDDIVYVVEPFHQHERMSVQQGLFLFPGNIEKPFEHNLCSAFELAFKDLSNTNASKVGCSEINKIDPTCISLLKIVMPYSLHSSIFNELNKMNVTAAALFPGLDGFARSLSFHFRYLEYLTTR